MSGLRVPDSNVLNVPSEPALDSSSGLFSHVVSNIHNMFHHGFSSVRWFSLYVDGALLTALLIVIAIMFFSFHNKKKKAINQSVRLEQINQRIKREQI